MDFWQFKKSKFPLEHMKVIKQITNMIADGVEVYYITGNHDDTLRKFNSFSLGNFSIVNQLEIKLPEGKAWFFHGDVFDMVIQNTRWLAKLGAIGYEWLVRINTLINFFNHRLLKRNKIKFSKTVKDFFKRISKKKSDFEKTAVLYGISKKCRYVICGHIHKPQIKEVEHAKGTITYLNSGDWVDNLTALEYDSSGWRLYTYPIGGETHVEEKNSAPDIMDADSKLLYENLLEEMVGPPKD